MLHMIVVSCFLLEIIEVMADTNGRALMLDPRRNQSAERMKLYEEMLLKEIPGIHSQH